jgi:hypothetical protein
MLHGGLLAILRQARQYNRDAFPVLPVRAVNLTSRWPGTRRIFDSCGMRATCLDPRVSPAPPALIVRAGAGVRLHRRGAVRMAASSLHSPRPHFRAFRILGFENTRSGQCRNGAVSCVGGVILDYGDSEPRYEEIAMMSSSDRLATTGFINSVAFPALEP